MNSFANRRVLIYLPTLATLGGAERQALRFGGMLAAAGAKVEIWGKSPLGAVAEAAKSIGATTAERPHEIRVKPLQRWLTLRALTKQIRAGRFDWVVPYTTGPNILCNLTGLKAGTKACIWNQRDEGQGLGKKPVDFKAAANARVLVSNSEHARQLLVERMGVPAERTRVVHNGVQLDAPRETPEVWRDKLRLPANAPVCVMLANLTSRKDHHTLIEAWTRVHATMPEAVLVLAGDHGDRYGDSHTLISELGLDDVVRLSGAVSDVPGLLSVATLGVFSSRLEGCPNGVLECMAAGLAVAGTDIPGIEEALGSREHLAPPGDADALSARILALLGNDELRNRAAAANRARIGSYFSPQRMFEGMVQALQDAET